MTETASVVNVAVFQQPYPHALINGRNVRLMALGDAPGKSPAFLYINEEGKTIWESQNKFTITDPNCLPLTASLTTTR